MDGHGTPDDPYRPRYFKNPKDKNCTGINVLAWIGQLTQDRHHYFAEIAVARESDLGPMLNDAEVQHWDKHTTRRKNIDDELKVRGITVNWDRLKVGVR